MLTSACEGKYLPNWGKNTLLKWILSIFIIVVISHNAIVKKWNRKTIPCTYYTDTSVRLPLDNTVAAI